MDRAGTCLRCGKPYQEGDTVCFSCGAPIGETQTPTQPVPVIHIPRAQPPEAAKPRRVTTLARHTAKPVPHASTAERRRTGPLVLLVVVLFIVAVGGAFYVAQRLTARPQVPTQVTYHDPQRRFSLVRPGLWSVTVLDDGVLLSDSSGLSTAQVQLTAPSAGETAVSHADELASQKSLQAAPPLRFAGATWQQRSAQVTGADGAVRMDVVLVTEHSGIMYTLEFNSPVASYSGVNTLVYQPLMASFAFH